MATRFGGRDTSQIVDIRFFTDEQHINNYLEFKDCLGGNLTFIDSFPLLKISKAKIEKKHLEKM